MLISTAFTNVPEGNSGTNQFSFTVILTVQPTADVVVGYTVDGTATNGQDYSITPTSLTFTPAIWNIAQIIRVTFNGDTIAEPDETVIVILGPISSTDARYDKLTPDPASATLTILDDDSTCQNDPAR